MEEPDRHHLNQGISHLLIGCTEKGRSFLGIPAKNSLNRTTRKHEAATPNGGTFCKITALSVSFQPDNWMQHVSLDWVTSQEIFFLLYTRTFVWPLVNLIKAEKSVVSLLAYWPWSLDCGYVRERCYGTDTHIWGREGGNAKHPVEPVWRGDDNSLYFFLKWNKFRDLWEVAKIVQSSHIPHTP